jgi:hypothetical protein
VQPDENSVEYLDQIAARIAKRRRLARITPASLAVAAGVGLDVSHRLATGPPVAHDDLIAVIDGIEHRRSGVHIPTPRTESSESPARTA